MVRLSELRATAQNSRPSRPAATLPDDIITRREEGEQAEEEGAEEEGEEEREVEATGADSRPRRRRPARLPEAATKAEPEEKVRGKRQKDFDLSEQNESSDEESPKRERARAAEEPWTQNQQKLLELALQQYPKGSSDRWDKIAKCVPSKSKLPPVVTGYRPGGLPMACASVPRWVSVNEVESDFNHYTDSAKSPRIERSTCLATTRPTFWSVGSAGGQSESSRGSVLRAWRAKGARARQRGVLGPACSVSSPGRPSLQQGC
ncbi:hypothetical protein CB1_001913015 [Camelus ferus]|nr:hypothetical protein CB1_001913015 [Camelus ferus]